MALLAKLILFCLLFTSAVIESSMGHQYLGDHREFSSDKMVLPQWYQERLVRARHDSDSRQVFQETAAKSSWSREDFVERSTATTTPRSLHNRSQRHHVEHHRSSDQRTHGTATPEKFSAVAVAEFNGTRAIAFTGYHNNHRHQPREAVTDNYRYVATTPSSYTRHHPGRRVCTRQVPTSSTHHHRGRQIRIVYTGLASGFSCCPGWTQMTHLSFGCNKPACPSPCLNGGICSTPGKCTCPKGFTGNQCQTDVDECVTEKPCDQLCRNLPGTYECYCKPGFHLQQDGQSCRKNDTEDTAFEARDLEKDFHEPSTTSTRAPSTTSSYDTENEVGDADLDQDYEIILKRLTKLEKQLARGKRRDTETTEMSTKITSAFESINEMKKAMENVQLMQQELSDMRSKMKEFELEARKIHYLTNRVVELEGRLKSRCRSAVYYNGGSMHYG